MSIDRQFMRLFAGRYRSGLILVGIASVMLNVLVFAGSAYMLLVYDSVLPSRSVPTLTQVPLSSLKSSVTRPSNTRPWAGSASSTKRAASPCL